MVLTAGLTTVFMTEGAFDIDLGQFFLRQVQVTRKEPTEKMGLVQIEHGFVGYKDLKGELIMMTSLSGYFNFERENDEVL